MRGRAQYASLQGSCKLSSTEGGGNVLVQCVLVARMVLEDEWIAEHARAGRWRHRQVWLGKPLSRRQEKRLRKQAAKEERERDLETADTR